MILFLNLIVFMHVLILWVLDQEDYEFQVNKLVCVLIYALLMS